MADPSRQWEEARTWRKNHKDTVCGEKTPLPFAGIRARVQMEPAYLMSQYLAVINQVNKLLHKISFILLP